MQNPAGPSGRAGAGPHSSVEFSLSRPVREANEDEEEETSRHVE